MKSTLFALVGSLAAFAVLPLLHAAAPAASPLAGYTPPKIHQQYSAAYPTRMLHEGVMRGNARIILEIGPDGQLADSLIIAYTRREFAQEADRAIKRWRFEPGRLNNEPVTTILEITFEFEVSGVIVHERSLSTRFDENAFENDEFAYRPRGLKSLDRIPVPVAVTPPIYPKDWIESGRAGTVTVQFFIDEEGRTRIPWLVGDADRFLAASALMAVKDWRFEPPTRRGKPVLVQAEQSFVFRPPSTKTAARP